MRNILITILTVLFSTAVIGQDVPSINIAGETSYTVSKIKNYVIHIQLKDVKSDEYSNLGIKTLDQVTTEYRNKLAENDVDFNKFSENKTLYIYSAYGDTYNESSNYTFITSSETEILNVIKSKVPGLTIMSVEINAEPFPSEKISELTTLAINNAKEKAEKIAKNVNKKLGGIISISNENYDIPTYSYYTNENLTFMVKVEFELL